jgi:transcription antitermination factor NusG
MGKDDEGVMNVPQYVPDKQMTDFIKVVRTMGFKPVDPDIDLRKGDRVRVLTGPFEGVEGVYVRMPNRHEKRVVIKIEGVAAVATMALNASDIEKI